MLKKLIVLLNILAAASSFAAVDVNKATAAELDGISGIGPGLSNRILEERKKGNFKDWADLIGRVSGVQESRARTLSAEGVTVNGMAFKPAATAVAAQAPASAASAPAKPETTSTPACISKAVTWPR
jgi:competence protein ComEA